MSSGIAEFARLSTRLMQEVPTMEESGVTVLNATVTFTEQHEMGLDRFVRMVANALDTEPDLVFSWVAYYHRRAQLVLPERVPEDEVLRCFDAAAYYVQRALVEVRLHGSVWSKRNLDFYSIVCNRGASTSLMQLVKLRFTETQITMGKRWAQLDMLVSHDLDKQQVIQWFKRVQETPDSDADEEVTRTYDTYNDIKVRSIDQDFVLCLAQSCYQSTERIDLEQADHDIMHAIKGPMNIALSTVLQLLREIALRFGRFPELFESTQATYDIMKTSHTTRMLLVQMVSLHYARDPINKAHMRKQVRDRTDGALLELTQLVGKWLVEGAGVLS
jgi:hypothetical protein